VSVQSSSSSLEFLAVCNDPAAFTVMAAAIHAVDGRLNCAPTCAAAADYLARRKIDGIVIDMSVSGALEFLRRVRSGNANKFSVVFACLDSARDSSAVLDAGANFILRKPLDRIGMMQAFAAAVPLMAAEKRRFFRYSLMLPVALTVGKERDHSTMSNLSEGGMAVWSVREYALGTAVGFSFTLPFGGLIRGEGRVAWTNPDGAIGIKFHILPDSAYSHLYGWLNRRVPKAG
jgi:DNA-binding NarL/FixJ family response regulator